MPAFPTPTPPVLTVSVQAGDLEIIASNRPDTVVTVTPRSASRRVDLTAAEQTSVTHADGQITVTGPRHFSVFGPVGSIVITVELPTGSRVEADVSYGTVRGRGRLGDCRVKTAYGDLTFDDTGAAQLHTSGGDLAVGTITGDARLTVGNGAVRVDLIDGDAVAKSSNGDLVIGEVTGELEASTSSGEISVQFPGTVTAVKTAYGRVRIGDAPAGSLRLETSYGEIEVGVPEGTAAWLDVSSGHGVVRSELDPAGAPDAASRTLEVRARTKFGDITIRRPIGRRPGDRRDARRIAPKENGS